MADLEIGEGAGGGGGIGGIPTKYLLMGGGAAVLAFILYSRKSSGATADPNTAPTTLGPNASLAVGSLDNDFRTGLGDLQQLLTQQNADLSSHLDTSAAALGAAGTAQYNALVSGAANTDSLIAGTYGALASGQAATDALVSGLPAFITPTEGTAQQTL